MRNRVTGFCARFDADSAFFVTTENEDEQLNSLLTELNDTPNIQTLQDLLVHASRLFEVSFLEATNSCVTKESLGGPLELAQSAVVVLSMSNLHKLQEQLIDDVSAALGEEKAIAALLLHHCRWDKDLLYLKREANSSELRTSAGVTVGSETTPCQGPQLCSVCFVDEALACLPCGHGLCEDDWPGFLKCNLDSGTVGGENCLRLKCPGELCSLLVPSTRFERFLEASDYARYLQLRVISMINDNDKIVRCPADGCEFCVRVGSSQQKSTVRCNCGHAFCFSCKLVAHAPAKCSSAKAWFAKAEKMKDVMRLDESASGDVKPCPNPQCSVPSRKESGCHYLHCSQCGANWL